MAALNQFDNNNWEEIETICLQSESVSQARNATNDTIDEINSVRSKDTTSLDTRFVEKTIFGTSKKIEESFAKSRVEEETMIQVDTEDKESLKTRHSKGSRRPSVDTLTDGKSITSQSDTRSYREKLKDRINVVKERAGVSAVSAQKGLKYIQKTSSKNALLGRITDMLLKEEADVKEALEKHTKSKLRKKQENTATKDTGTVKLLEMQREQDISYETSVEFFTKTWKSPDENASTESALNSPRKEMENVAQLNNGNEDGVKILTADYLGLKETLMEPAEFKTPTLADEEQRKNKQQELIFHTTSNANESAEKNGNENDHQPTRNVKDEGLFVPNHPRVKLSNVNRLRQRLITANNEKWFAEEDGELIRLPLPLEATAYHPLNFNETTRIDQAFASYFETAILFGRETQDLCSMYVGDEHWYVLELEIKDIVFTHHPLFCREHVLANKLGQLYGKYEYRLDAAITKRLTSKLRALRTARDNLNRIILAETNPDMATVHKERLAKYKTQIQEIRKQRNLEGKNDNSLLMNLLSTWKELKRVRAQQGYTSSNIKLVILKSDHFLSAQEWQNEVKRHVEEMLEEWKERNACDKENVSKNADENDRTNIAAEPNLKAIQEQALENVSESMPAPEEQAFIVSLIQQEITNDNELTNSMEIQRRSLMSRSRVWFRIFYNGHEVCKSTPQSLERNFGCTFNQKFSIRVQEWPETLSVQIFCDGVPSKGIFNEHPLAEIFIPIPHCGATLENVALEKYEFSSTDEVGIGVRHSGVGSGVPFKLFEEDEKTICCYTTASVTCKIAWATNNERVLSPPEYYFNKINAKRLITENTAKIQSDASVLKQWLKNVQLDPNDPTNVPLLELLKKSDKNAQIEQKFFNVDSVQRMFDFCSDEEMAMNPRFRLLCLRDRGEMEFKNIKTIPLREWEIPKDMFKNYEKRVSSPELPFDTIGLGQLEIHRAWGEHSLNMLYDRILKLCKLSQLHRSTPDVIHEEKVPDIGTLGLTFMKLLQPKRPLRPRRKGRKRIPVKGLTGQEVKVIVNVVRAFEVPIRKDVDTLTEDTISYVPVRPFVEVTFKGQTKRTVTADGPNPTWNQDLHFSLMGPNDGSFQVSNMQSFGDSLHIHLFDEIIVDILEDERIRETTIHQRLDRNWLGSLRIPFSTLYFNHQVEGTFQLYSPPFLLGYDRQVSLASSEQSHLRNSTFLTLFIIVQPPLSPPDPIMENLECNEPAYLEQYLELWAKEVNREVPHRPVKTLVTDVGGKSVCVTRFFRAISPPVIYENENATPEMIARYVSLIPVSTSGALLFGHFNVWLTCDQTIRLLLGEREDHAILLCCFLMKLGLKAWLLFGNGIPHGHSAYVLTRHDAPLMTPVYNIWDPVTGLKYSSMDSFSPLHKVYCLINDENIWINTQKEELIRRTNFDVSQRSDWWPAFGRQMPPPSNSVQPDSIEYTLTSDTDVHLLQDKIEKFLRDSIMKWRPTSRTIWNRYCIATLRKLLPIMEREACGLKQQSNSDHLAELQHILASHKICGFPISQAFTNIKAIIEAVKSTGVHINESPDVEFALAVYVHPYPNDVLSVWVYAVSLVARR